MPGVTIRQLSTVILTVSLLALSVQARSVIFSDGFETSYDGWTTHGDYVELTAAGGEGYNSPRAIKVSGRKSADDGAVSAKGFYLDGGETYDYSVYVKHAGPSAETFKLTIRWLMPDGETYGSEVIATKTAAPNEWTPITASYATPRGSVNQTFFITANSAIDFYFDDFAAAGGKGASLQKSAKAAEPNEVLKDVYANYWRVGTILGVQTVNNSTMKALVLREFNSVTCENEMKPDATTRQSGSTDNNIQVQLNTTASAILKWCSDNKVGVRGHTLVWHSQSPRWFYRADVSATSGDTWASPEVMYQRMESYIKNLFALIKERYPDLDLYAYDVLNETYLDNGNFRSPGSGGDRSPLVQIFGANTTWIDSAFTFARRYAPATCKLYYNDFNEYQDGKRKAMTDLAKALHGKGVLDGIGMQSHLSTTYPDSIRYSNALTMFASVPGIEISVTELDITMGSESSPIRDPSPDQLQTQAVSYRRIMNCLIDAKKAGANIQAVAVWGIQDNQSWRSWGSPLLFDKNGQKKPAYTTVIGLIPQSEWGDGGRWWKSNGEPSDSGKTSVFDVRGASANNKSARPSVTVRGRMLSVSSPSNSALSVKMIDVRGKTVARYNVGAITNRPHTFALTNIPAGRYFVEVRGAGIKQALPVVVK